MVLMYAREWKCICPEESRKDFLAYLHRSGVKGASAFPGCKGYQIMELPMENQSQLTVITFWDSLESIKLFSGENVHIARILPEEELFGILPEEIVEIHTLVEHYQHP